MSAEEYELLKAEVATLHETLEGKGMNSKGTKDVFGRLFPVPVDEEHKSTVLFSVMFNGIVPNFPQPHMHVSTGAPIVPPLSRSAASLSRRLPPPSATPPPPSLLPPSPSKRA